MLRTVVVVGLSALVIGLTLPNMFVARDMNQIPFSVDFHYDVISLTPDSIATQAGLRVGDHIEPPTTDILARMAMQTWYLYRPGSSTKFIVDRAGSSIPIVLRYPAAQATGVEAVSIVKRSTATIFIVVAAILLLLRPSLMTWGFWLYAIGSTNGGSAVLEFVGTTPIVIANTALVTICYNILAPLGLLIFATNFPSRSSSGWRYRIEKLIPIFSILLALPSVSYVLFLLGIVQPSATFAVMNVVTEGVGLIALATLAAGFVLSGPEQRQRLRWVVAGFAIFYAAYAYQELSQFLPGQGWPSQWTNAGDPSDILNGLVVFIPISVAYAVFKHHVLDLNFVIGRGLVYGILTSLAVAVFAIIEWFIGGVLAQTRLAAAGEVVAAVAIGFWLNRLHGRVDRLVDSVIFRKRHLAEQRLARVASGLQHSESYSTIAQIVVEEPMDALGFRSAAFYRRVDNGDFARDAAEGVDKSNTPIGAHDPLLVHLNGERGPVMLDQIGWNVPGLPIGENTPIVALPVFNRHQLRAIALYGPHETGEAIDPDEMRSLAALCSAAGAALDHTAAAELSQRLEEYRQTVNALRADLQTLRSAAAI
ncbi:MAG TPA: hypothetical protein VFO25_11130 [Candidatus Eremiobacteraceae bacterium]|nr:hypothetical protein [Candidatus Eremiobacteraceae bacterium]